VKRFVAALSFLILASSVFPANRALPLRIAWWGSQLRHERTIRVLQAFEKENPGVTIDYEFGGWNDYWTRVTTMAAGNNLPDIIQQDYQYLTEWESRGLILSLDEYERSGVLDFSGVTDGALEGGRTGGSLFGVSLGINSTCILLDVDAFKKAGIALPGDNWTWADFERIGLALSRKLGITAVSGNIVHDHIWRSIYLGVGMWVYAKDGRTLGYPESEDSVFVNQFKMARRLEAAKAMMPWSEIVASRSKGVEDDWIVKGKSVMEFLWSNQVVAAWTAAGFESRRFELRPLPRVGPAAASSNYLKPSMFFSITKSSAHPELSAKLIDYFTNSIEANRILLAERGVPIASSVRDALKPLMEPPQRAVFDYLARIQKSVAPIPPPDPVGNTDLVNNVFIPQVMDPVMFGVISPEEGMKRLRQEAAKILGK
jgi:multiple sugar transport system substrate-binding protein